MPARMTASHILLIVSHRAGRNPVATHGAARNRSGLYAI
jgi:hypothetical protein